MRDLFVRYQKNPILSPKDLEAAGFSASGVFNAGAAKVNGKYLLLLRVNSGQNISYLLGADSQDGISGWQLHPEIIFEPRFFEDWGFEDPRLTYLPDIGHWAITYVHFSPEGAKVRLALTRNFWLHEAYTFFGNVLPPNNKDAALFPRPIKGRWCMLHRPMARTREIWLSWTRSNGLEDLGYWGRHQVVLRTDGTPRWDGAHIGLSAPPLETKDGWLICYHGARRNQSGVIYQLGLALLDLDDPSKVIYRSREPIMTPRYPYEMIGEVDKVIFPCGWVLDEEENLRLYYGAADKYLCLAQAPFKDVLASVSPKLEL